MNDSTSAAEILQRARQLWLSDEFDEALESFRQAMRHSPGDLRLAIEVASYLALRFEIPEARRVLDQLVEPLANHPAGLHQLGLAYERAFCGDRALACYERAVKVEPEFLAARLALVAWYERRGDYDQAQKQLDLVGHSPGRDSADARLWQCRVSRHSPLAVHSSRGAGLEGELLDLANSAGSQPQLRITAWYELAGLYDGRDEVENAYQAAVNAKSLQMSAAAPLVRQARAQARLEANFVDTIQTTHFARWQNAAAAGTASSDPLPGVALLTGLPRSGTTLLARMVGHHPDVSMRDEWNVFPTYIHRELLRGKSGISSAAALDSLSEEHVARCRQRYLRCMMAARSTPRPQEPAEQNRPTMETNSYFQPPQQNAGHDPRLRWLLDKNPSITFLIPAWRRLFPQAPVIVSLRDPLDVVLSCFLTRFNLNPVSAMFCRLDMTVARCLAEWQAWLTLRQKLTQPWCEIHYEAIAARAEAPVRDLLSRMSLPWHDGLFDFGSELADEPTRSPSYAQIFQPIATGRVGRWLRYERYLAPYLESLKPIRRAFGYD